MKKSVKRLLSITLALMLMVSTFIIPASAAGYDYTVDIMYANPTLTEDAAIKTDGSIWGWGRNDLVADQFDEQGGVSGYRSTPVKSNNARTYVAVGDDWGITADGELWGWGHLAGSAGTGAPYYSTTAENAIKIMDDVAAYSGMWEKTERAYLALKTDGTLVGWGTPATLTGAPDYEDIDAKNAIVLATDVKQFVALDMYWMMVKNDGTLWACGYNYKGLLTAPIGGGNDGELISLTKVMDHVAAISMHYEIAFVIKEDGTLWSWGSNYHGERGTGEEWSNQMSTPTKILDDVVYVKSLWYTSFAITSDGTLYGWGHNSYSQLGFDGGNYRPNNDNAYQTTPKVLATNVVAVAGGPYTTIILKSDGTVWSCGSNSVGECGVPQSQSIPRGSSEYVSGWTKILDGVAMPGSVVSNSNITPPPAPTPSDAAFADTAGHWANDYIQKAVDNGLISGAGNNRFEPDRTVSNAEWAQMIVNLMGYTATSELVQGYWWSQAFSAVVENDLYAGTKIYPFLKSGLSDSDIVVQAEHPIDRGTMAAIIYNIGKQQGWGIAAPDNISESIADWNNTSSLYHNAIAYCYANGFITGIDSKGTFASNESMTRAAAATVLCRMYDAKTGNGTSTTTPVTPEDTTKPTDTTAPSETPMPTVSIDDYRQEVFELTNAERAKVGAAALKLNDDLSVIAQARAEALAELGYLPSNHNIPGMGDHYDSMRTFGFKGATYAGENFATGATPSGAMANWRSSTAGHWQNLLGQLKVGSVACTWTDIGIGCAEGSNGVYYWVQIFVQ
ncbi:S-layer homology domain-containing protein [Oscillospiraceae bacterium OttesenSCG-928-G22]|nr:S-layer homology domain-containing protein [Oscillospiraceae bacterium OttesenSCG-928-G22]